MRDGKIRGDKYIVEISRSLAERVGEHIRNGKERKDLWRHLKVEHNEEQQPFELNFNSTAPCNTLLCQLTEPILYRDKKPIMNA